MSRFSAYVLEKRTGLNLTQTELAQKIGTHWSLIANIEQGKAPPIKHFGAIAAAFGVNPAILIDIYLADLKDRALRKIDLKTM